MSRVSVLQELYRQQRQSVIEPNRCWQGKYRFCLIWIFIGILLGGIPLTVFTIGRCGTYELIDEYNCAVLAYSPTLRWNPVGITVAGITGIPGTASNQLNTPYDAKLDHYNTLYIADRDNNRTQKYLVNTLNGSTVAGQTNGSSCVLADCLKIPYGLHVDSNGDLFIVDTMNSRIQYWKNGALTGITVAGNSTGKKFVFL